MVSISSSLEVDASVDSVWKIVSDVDRDAEYWNGLSSIKNVRKEENLVERIVKVGFMGNEGHQIVKLKPKESIELSMTRGPLIGSRQLKLTTINDGRKTKLEVAWDFRFSGVPIFARAFVKSQIEAATEEALDKIAWVADEISANKDEASVASSS